MASVPQILHFGRPGTGLELREGMVIKGGPLKVTEEEVLAFARKFDPQWFHTDVKRAELDKLAVQINTLPDGQSLALLVRIYRLRAPDSFLQAPADTFGDANREKALLGDDLVQRSGYGVEPTPGALALWPSVREALSLLRNSLAPGAFDPAGAGNTFRLTPKHSVSLGAQLVQPLGGSGVDMFLTPTFSWKSRVYFEETNLPAISQGAYGTANLRAGLRAADGSWTVTAYAQNLFDREYLIDAGNTGAAFGLPTFIAGPPRFYGVEVSVRF